MTDGVYAERVWFEDFAAGDRFVYGAYELSEQEIIEFASKYDPEPFHVDPEAARALGWGGLIASGPHLGAIWRRLSKDAFPKAETVISPGWDEIRWLAPARPGDVLVCHSEIAEARLLRSRPGEGHLRMRNAVQNQSGTVVMTLVTNWFIRCRSAAQPTGA